MKIKQNKMMGYLAVTAGVGCASSAANAAVVFYGNATNKNLLADPNGINISHGGVGYGGIVYGPFTVGGGNSTAFWFNYGSNLFTRGTDGVGARSFSYKRTYFDNGWLAGAVMGSQNYAQLSFDADPNLFEAVAQFYFDGNGGGYLMAIATTNAVTNPQNLGVSIGGPTLSISAGKAMIDAAGGVNNFSAAVPEPTSLGLLALGAMGLATRRQRRKAA